MITRTRLLDNTDIARLGDERQKRCPRRPPPKGGKKGKKAASPMPRLDSTEMESWEEVEEGVETDVGESESGEESELEGVVVVRGGEVGNFRGFFRS